MSEYYSTCTHDCSGACAMRIRRNDDGTITVTGDSDHPYTRGLICHKGRRAVQRLFRKDRITTPLMKKGGEFVSVDWDTALNTIASHIDTLRATPEAMLYMRSFGHRGVLAETGTYLFRSLGASATRGGLCDDAGISACKKDFGALDQNDPQDIANAAYIVNWGKDLSLSSPHVGRLVDEAREKGAKLVTISPDAGNHKKFADHHIRIRPGSDRFLAAAVTLRMILNGEMDSRAIFNLSNWEEFQEVLGYHSEEHLLDYCDAKEDDLKLLLDIYTNVEMRPVSTLIGWGLQRYRYGGQNVRFINLLAYLSGQTGMTGAGVYYGVSSSRNFNRAWIKDLPAAPRTFLMPQLGKEMLAADPPVKMLWVESSNVVNQAPDTISMIAAMENIPFKVVVDAFMTDTAMRADIILPCALAHEHEDIVGSSFHNYISVTAKVFDAPGEARDGYDIITGLASRLAEPLAIPDRDTILTNALDSEYINTNLDLLRTIGWTRATRPLVVWRDFQTAYADGKYSAPDILLPEPDSAEYPLHLLTLADRRFLQSQRGEEEQDGLPVCEVSISNPVLGTLDLQRPVYLASPQGRLEVRVTAADALHNKTVIVRRGGWFKTGHGINSIIAPICTDLGDGAAYYSQRVRLEQDPPEDKAQ